MGFDAEFFKLALSFVIMTVYAIALILILMYSLAQLNLLINYLRAKKKEDTSPRFDLNNPNEVPYVTIQLPVYNELYVMERLLDNIAKIDYPAEKLEIQVLDDSTDESVISTAKQIKELQKQQKAGKKGTIPTRGMNLKDAIKANKNTIKLFEKIDLKLPSPKALPESPTEVI